MESDQGNLVESLYKKIIYIMRITASQRDYIYGAALSVYNPYGEMMLVKETFDQSFGKGYFHYTLNPETADILDLGKFYNLATNITEVISNFCGHYQVLMAIHFNEDQYHMHFIANNIDYITGKRLDINRHKLSEIKDCINTILMQYGVSVIRKKDNSDQVLI